MKTMIPITGGLCTHQKLRWSKYVNLLILNMQDCFFGYFGQARPNQPKLKVSTYGKLSCASASKNPTSSITSFLRYHKDIANLSGHFGYAWSNQSETTCRKLWRLSACKKIIFITHFCMLHTCYFEYFKCAS